VLSFSNMGEAQAAIIPDNVNALQIFGFNRQSDGGGGSYVRVASLPSVFTGTGAPVPTSYGPPVPPVPPGFITGAPNLVYSTTWWGPQLMSLQGPSAQPIVAHSLAIMIIYDGPLTPASNYTDSVGNLYVLGASANIGGSQPVAIYYCADTKFAPIGSNFGPTGPGALCMDVYCVPGFVGAVLDKTNSATAAGVTTISVSTGALALSFPQLVIGAVHTGQSPMGNPGAHLTYVPGTGWIDIAPPLGGRNPISAIGVNSAASVTYMPNWSGSPTGPASAAAIVATFSGFNRTVLNPSYWQLLPSWPVHSAQYGIPTTMLTGAPTDAAIPFQNFSIWLASIAPPSNTSLGGFGTTAGSCTITSANPAVVTITTPKSIAGAGNVHNLHQGQMISFASSVPGHLPAPIIDGQRYYIQYGTVTQTTFQISTSGIFGSGGRNQIGKGAPVNTSGSAQSGTFSYTIYGDSWADIVLDPGIYFASFGQLPGFGYGLRKWRMFGYGAKLQYNAYFSCATTVDPNADTAGTTLPFQTKFNTSYAYSDGVAARSITLSTTGLAGNFYINSWVMLMCNETQGSAQGNFNPATFEFAKIAAISGDTITFYDPLRYGYRSTFPNFKGTNATYNTAVGSGTIVQLPDAFDQEIEIRGLTFEGVTEQDVSGVLSLRLIDCEIYGWGYKTGPFPSTIRQYIMKNCNVHNAVAEVDKMVDFMAVVDCTFDQFSNLFFQSASVNMCIVDRCYMMGGINGTPKTMVIKDSFVGSQFTIGTGFGVNEKLYIENSHISNIRCANSQGQPVLIDGNITFSAGSFKVAVGVTTNFGFWHGSSAVSSCPIPWGIPGGKGIVNYNALVNQGVPAAGGPDINYFIGIIKTFTVLDVHVDGSDNYTVDTDLAVLPQVQVMATGTMSGAVFTVSALTPSDACLLQGMTVVSAVGGTFPAGTSLSSALGVPNATNNLGAYTMSAAPSSGSPTSITFGAALNLQPHPAPQVTVRSCTGGRWASDQVGAPSDIPIMSYFKRAFNGEAWGTYFSFANVGLTGNLLSWEINVTKAYAGTSTGTFVCTICMFGWKTDASGNFYPVWVTQTINLKTAGVRTITSATATTGAVAAGIGGTFTAGGLSGDTLVPIPFWLAGGHQVTIVNSTSPLDQALSSMPRFVMRAQTDQGIDAGSMTVNTPNFGMDIIGNQVLGSSMQY
jgi:hypothetical protein